ncbi:hypothetical protein BDD14_6014 [Edaphobacter modestus]|uniref:Uncharacterized protein n=1 Tax=Edaphobacter modestus TaxID=388466 RepID=A0A4Q7YFM8_9BACT|nr:hypothetical protein [Edaphobacter modestus]RZU35251.1 hypothetical protein BDD14_6014 [Edaphobacter modestus]
MVTNTAEASPLIETITPAVKWANCETSVPLDNNYDNSQKLT